MFQRLEEIGWHVGLFVAGSTKTRGRKVGSALDLDNLDQLAKVIKLSMPNGSK
jgi:hypothetical protein